MNWIYLALFNIVTPDSLQEIKAFSLSDLNTEDPLLIYIFYERANHTCSYCKIVSREIAKLTNINIRKLNYYKDPFNGSRFFSLFFPTIVLYDHHRTHYLEIDTHQNLQNIINNASWLHEDCKKIYSNPVGYFVYFYALTNYVFYFFLKRIYFLFDILPSWALSVFIGLMFSAVIIIFVSIFMDCFKYKEKDD